MKLVGKLYFLGHATTIHSWNNGFFILQVCWNMEQDSQRQINGKTKAYQQNVSCADSMLCIFYLACSIYEEGQSCTTIRKRKKLQRVPSKKILRKP